ncbi:MAG TPA: radical SAM protein [Bacteroidales bacterium]|nr:radical SAM protein [Bacteroidales bacterium]
MITFGPIPSRRLGKSLGINNIPLQKVCSYSCIYCQVGFTKKYSITREKFYEPEFIYSETQKHLEKISNKDWPNYLTFVSNGEPSLDINLGKSIKLLKTLNLPVAVITNASLLNYASVREDLKSADWVSVKIDAGNKIIWRAINKPLMGIDFKNYILGLLAFSKVFKGKLVSETMLVKGVNETTGVLNQTADLVSKINPSIAYISIPTRPPSISLVKAPDELVINEAYHIFSEKIKKTELLLGFEGTNTGLTGNAAEDILGICAVHPIREDTMREILKKDHASPTLLKSLISDNQIKVVPYNGNFFYIRKI